MTKPIIGITLDLEENNKYSKFPWYALRKNYSDSVIKGGGLPVFIPNEISLIKKYINLIDGLLITGGNFDIHPKIYGEKLITDKINIKKDRTYFELKITESAIKNNMSILGICGGQQLLNVVFGGNLFQHIPFEFDTKIEHEQENPRNEASHKVNIIRNTKLRDIVSSETMFVNSAHHQSVKKIGAGLKVNATAEDSVIEGIEAENLRFCLGIQWHPEFLIDKNDIVIFNEFIKAAKTKE
ncbi:MAG: gamma-glutamyl-gamma-aminobutyrate hydrolase [Rickettsiales bacterium]|nr:gamma-glutamyl-gamma-aminobutyrate hydrolase [Rickettsiales bacterium]OUV53271.1 MAG: gamma-glutamyl-gamma-aminobutyrate hydrolase [Rickettsiales bacterium TMED127]|tara:strand:- start:20302 stop:21021 length:720 start_codon:yes stop_codon:yes gene_type:complete